MNDYLYIQLFILTTSTSQFKQKVTGNTKLMSLSKMSKITCATCHKNNLCTFMTSWNCILSAQWNQTAKCQNQSKMAQGFFFLLPYNLCDMKTHYPIKKKAKVFFSSSPTIYVIWKHIIQSKRGQSFFFLLSIISK